MVLNQKLESTGSHKGMIFSTSHFQKGAIGFAKAHGIALIHVESGKKRVFVTNQDTPAQPKTEQEVLLDSYTSSLLTSADDPQFPYLGRPDVYPGENLKVYLSLLGRTGSGD
jgi:restriction system protein